MQFIQNGKITLVGAGPGDPDLITVKGVKAITCADVVLYDALSNEALLDYAPETAERIFVGKRAGQHSHKQEDINALIAQKAMEGNHVVRLKGGDPFVFGRGHEELEYAQLFDLPVEIIPGISSCIAVPELQAVPLTRRNYSESFWVITATKKLAEFSSDIQLAAQSTATVVILMGVRKLPFIVEAFKENKRGNAPVMIVQNGSLPQQKVVLSTVDHIEEAVKNSGLSSPAVITIGEVVKLHPLYSESIDESDRKPNIASKSEEIQVLATANI